MTTDKKDDPNSVEFYIRQELAAQGDPHHVRLHPRLL